MLSVLRQFEPANARHVFFGHGFDIAEVMDLARTEAPKPSKLAKYAAPVPAQQHTSNSGREFATELAVKFAHGRSLNAIWFEYFAKIEGVAPRVANGDSFALAAEWLTHLHGARTKEIAEITKTLSLLLDRLEVSGPAELSKDLGKVDVENAHPYHLLAVLRSLFNQRHSIPNWRSLERRTRVVFEKKDMNPSRVMKGLDVDGDEVRAAR